MSAPLKSSPQPRDDMRRSSSVPEGKPDITDAMTEDELLDLLGPSWAAMTPAERVAYGPPSTDTQVATTRATRKGGRRSIRQKYPALALWWDELDARYHGQHPDQPTTWRLDTLWRAACWEKAALDAERDGFATTADRCWKRAREIVREAASRKRRPA